jgi:hypothetical protein
LTGYTGPSDVVIPDMLDGLMVTGFGASAFQFGGISSISISKNIKKIGRYSFTTAGAPNTFTNINLSGVTDVSEWAFGYCTNLLSITFSENAPAETNDVFTGIPPNQVTIYVANPTATGWGATWNGMPVTRKTVNADDVITIGDISAGGNVEAASYTLNGEPFTGGGSSAPLAWTPISTLATGAVITVTPDTSRKIFMVDAAIPVTITNDTTTLAANCTTNYEWEVWVNVMTNSSSAFTFVGVDYVNGSPEITCPGVYKYALSTVCGTRIQARQTWPTVHAWSMPLIGAGPASSAYYNLANNVSGSLTNHIRMYFPFAVGEVILVRHPIAFTASTPDTAIRYETSDTQNGSIVVVSNIGTNSYAANTVYVNSVVVTNSGANSIAYAPSAQRLLRFAYEKSGNTVMSVGQPRMRKINELEQAHVNAGGTL